MKKIFILIISSICLSFVSLTLANNNSDYGLKTIIYAKNTTQNEDKSIYTTEISLALTKTQTAIGFNKYDLVPSSEALALLQKIEHLARINIIKSLDLSANKSIELHTYLQDTDKAVRQGDLMVSTLWQELILLKDDIESCLTDKMVADKEYFLSLKEYNTEWINKALEESKKQGKCASDKRIEFNAKTEIYKRLKYYQEILSKKFNYLSIKESLIIQNFDTVKEDITQELNNKILLENL